MKNKVLFLITSSFPFGNHESYLESEFKFIDNSFDQIYIISCGKIDLIKRETSPTTQVTLFRYLPTTYEKLKSLRFIFSGHFHRELGTILSQYKLFPSYGVIASLLGAISTGKRLSGLIQRILKHNNLHQQDLYAYSYWCDNTAVGLAFLKKSWPQVKCISRAHGYDVYFSRNANRYLPLRKLIFSRLDKVYFVSDHGRKYTSDKVGNFKSLHLSYLGTKEVGEFQKVRKSETLKLLSCSSLIPLKRVHLIIEALSLAKKVSIEWTHIGGGMELPSLKHQAQLLLGAKPNIKHSFRGQLQNQEVLSYYQQHQIDLFLSTSRSEGLPVSIMEALSNGVPAIGTDVGGTSEVIREGYNGFLLEKEFKAERLKDILISVSEMSAEQREQLSSNARNTWEKSFNADQVYEFFYQELLEP